jgi:hypothetical protein
MELVIISHQTVANWPNLFSHELRHVLMWCWCCVVVDKDGETVPQNGLICDRQKGLNGGKLMCNLLYLRLGVMKLVALCFLRI